MRVSWGVFLAFFSLCFLGVSALLSSFFFFSCPVLSSLLSCLVNFRYWYTIVQSTLPAPGQVGLPNLPVLFLCLLSCLTLSALSAFLLLCYLFCCLLVIAALLVFPLSCLGFSAFVSFILSCPYCFHLFTCIFYFPAFFFFFFTSLALSTGALAHR